MKRLKIISLFFLISILFIPNAKAINSDYYFEAKNTEGLQSAINNNQEQINKIKTYLENNCVGDYCVNDTTKDYLVAIQINNIDSTFYIRVINVSEYINGYYRTGLSSYWASNQYGTSGFFGWPETRYQQQFQFVNGELTATNTASLTSNSFGWNLNANSCNPTEENCILDNTNWYYDTSYIRHDVKWYINSSYCNGVNGCYYVPTYLSNDEETYTSGQFVSIKKLIDNLTLNIHVNPYICSLTPESVSNGIRNSVVSKIDDFTYRLQTNNISVDDEIVQGSYSLYNGRSSVSITDFTYNFNYDIDDTFTSQLQNHAYLNLTIIKGDNSIGDYNINGTIKWDNTYKTLIVSYNLVPTGSTPANIDVLLKITPNNSTALSDFFNGTMNYINCLPKNANDPNSNIYVDSSYGYYDNTTNTTISSDTSLLNFLNNISNPNLSFFNNISTLLPPGPIDSILSIPAVMLNSVNGFLSGTCTPLNVNLPFINQNIQLQCMNSFYENIGATVFFEGVGTIASVIILLNYLVFLYKYIDGVMRLEHFNVEVWGTDPDNYDWRNKL